MERSVQSDQFIVWNGIQNATEAVAGVPLIVCQHPAYPVGVAALIALLSLCLHTASGRSLHDLQIKLQSAFPRDVFGTAVFKRFGNAGLDKKVEKCTTVHTKLINGIVEHRTECAGRLREIVGVVSADRHCPYPP